MSDAVRESPARAEPHDATAWLPLPEVAELPPLERLLGPDLANEPAAPRDLPKGLPSPARAEPHDATAWLPLPEVDGLPSLDALLVPDPTIAPSPPREVPVGLPSPARAQPHDATAWLPLPELEPDAGGSGDDGSHPPSDGGGRRRRFHLPGRRLTGLVLATITLGALYSVTTVVLDKGADVVVRVDGRRITTETGASTVGALLAEQEVQLADYDRAVPPVDAAVENDMVVEVKRAFPVSVEFDGTAGTVQTTYHEAEGFVDDASAQLAPGTQLGVRDAPGRIDESSIVQVRTLKTGVLLVDGQKIDYEAPAHTVRELIEDYDVRLGDEDVTGPYALDDVLPAAQPDGSQVAVAVWRVLNETEQAIEQYGLPPEVRPDPNMDVSAPERVVPEHVGTQVVTYLLVRHNGVVTDRVPVRYDPVDPARPQITYYGTSYDPRWDKIAECETGGKWDRVKPTYQGGLGIWYGNWSAYGGNEFADNAGNATKYEQIIVAERIRADHGWGAWGCGKTLGYAPDDGKRQL